MADERGKIQAWGSGGIYKDGKRVSGNGPDRIDDLFSSDDEFESDDAFGFDRESWGPGFDSAEQAALSGYPPGEARVVGIIEHAADRVTLDVVVNQTGYTVGETCVRHEGRWYDIASG